MFNEIGYSGEPDARHQVIGYRFQPGLIFQKKKTIINLTKKIFNRASKTAALTAEVRLVVKVLPRLRHRSDS